MGIAANYANRSLDITFLKGVKASGRVTLEQVLFKSGNSGEVCTGIQKLIQRWVLMLLTPKGSMTFNPARGTTFMADLVSAYSYSDIDSIFRLCNMDACLQVKKEESDSMRKEERLERVELQSIEFLKDSVLISVKLTSKFGEAAPVVLPINTNPMPL